MTVKELIDELLKVKDKSLPVYIEVKDPFERIGDDHIITRVCDHSGNALQCVYLDHEDRYS